MRVIDTATLRPNQLDATTQHWVYNGLDTAVTLEVFNELRPQLGGRNTGDSNFDPIDALVNYPKTNKPEDQERRRFIQHSASQLTYNFERAMQGPALEMMQRGWRVNLFYRDRAVQFLQAQDNFLSSHLDSLATAVWGSGLNPNSPLQLKEFFFKSMGLPEQYRWDKGRKVVTTNREALEKLSTYIYARPFTNHILSLRDTRKKVSVLTTEVDSDKRMRTSYNVTGTESGRWSSSKNAYGGGTNLQNITEELRRCFVADKGYKLAYVDLSQAESRFLGFLLWVLFEDPTYLDACESGDLHTAVAQLVWPELPWTGNLKQDKEIAERAFYRHFSYRDLAKRGGHGTNYWGKPPTMARHLHVTTPIMEKFQAGYFDAFPGIPKYHQWCAQQIQLHQYMVTPLGMGRHFFSRPGDDATIREAIAFVPQSGVAQLLNLALYRIWRDVREVQLLGQVHDAVVLQYPEEIENEVLPKVLEKMATRLTWKGRSLVIPADVMIGWNWQKQDPKKKYSKDGNPDGLRGWDGNDTRTRQENEAFVGLAA